MGDNDHWRCGGHNHNTTCNEDDHCHYEEHHQETRGLLNRSTTSTIRCCHPRNHDHFSHQTRSCNHNHNHSRSCCSLSRQRNLIHDLENLLGPPRRNSDLAHLLRRIVNETSQTQSDDRSILHQILDGLFSPNPAPNSPIIRTTSGSNNDRDILVDLLLRITSSNSSNTNTNTITTGNENPPPTIPFDNPPAYCPYYSQPRPRLHPALSSGRYILFDDLTSHPTFHALQHAWLVRNAMSSPPFPASPGSCARSFPIDWIDDESRGPVYIPESGWVGYGYHSSSGSGTGRYGHGHGHRNGFGFGNRNGHGHTWNPGTRGQGWRCFSGW